MTLRSTFAEATTRWRPTNPYVLDAALAALTLFAVSLQWIFPDGGDDPLIWQGWLLGAATAVPLIWRRRAPCAVACAVSVATPAQALHHAPPPDVMYGGMVVLYTMAAQARPWQRRLMLTGWMIGVVVTMQHQTHKAPFEYAFHLMGLVAAYALGMLARVQRAYTAELEDRARRLERERAADTARARAEERARIARDMHDILAHAVSLMVVQAEAGPVVVRKDPDRAEATFDTIASTGRDAMAQLRRILGVLKEELPEGGTGSPRLPQPGVTALPELVRQVGRSTGLRAELRTSGEPRPLSSDTEVAAYRVVQEALTNTLKHARASRALVELDWADDHVSLTVTDDGRGPSAGPGGHGLIGIRERAAACGGSAETGEAPGGGFRVAVRLPVAAQRERALG
ncbi:MULTISPECIES: sensor histidine kinase [unclassified Streptomyces]|uniref:sensor histidine kinase n=1 Tax=unclassified Streptomyces TaxID=2593676 RepID=UPI001FD5A6F8|nr:MULTISPECIES: sensor histidine kinase [unclassified Streptomyces]MDH3038005.1 sensor histidine kinase [Streptomyces sp. TRM75561]